MSVRVHCRHAATQMDLYLEYGTLETAHALLPRLKEMGYMGVSSQPSSNSQHPASEPVAHDTLLRRLDRVEQLLQDLAETSRPAADHLTAHAAIEERLARVEQRLQDMQQPLGEQTHVQRPRVVDPTRPPAPAGEPKPSAPAQAPRSSPPVAAPGRPFPVPWQQILTHMRQHPGPHRPADLTQALGWSQPARHVLL